jgi:type IV secretory pathway TrbL component
MKALSTALTIVVTAIVLLVIAIVVVTIFGGAIAPVGGLAEAANNCRLQGQSSCAASGQLPVTWATDTQRYVENGQQILRSCQAVLGTDCQCDTAARRLTAGC